MKRLSRGPRAAFTLIELLVVISIIGVLIGLLVPAVQKVREAASRAQCQNNLKQIALAVHLYHDSAKHLPQNWGGNMGGGVSTWGSNSASWSWIAMILPYMDQGNIYKMAGLATTVNGVPQTPLSVTFNGAYVVSQPIPVLRCPSDPDYGTTLWTDRADMNGVSGRQIPVAITNYKGVCGSNWMWGNLLWNPGWAGANAFARNSFAIQQGLDNGNGVLWRSNGTWNKSYTLNGISDGASNTFMIGEDIPSHSLYCGSWAYANNASGTCAIYPNALMANLQLYPLGDWADNYSFFSAHPNGVQFAMCDGSVHYIENTIGTKVYWYLATAAGGEAAQVPNN